MPGDLYAKLSFLSSGLPGPPKRAVPDWAMIGGAGRANRLLGPHGFSYHNPETGTIESGGLGRIATRMLDPGWSQRVRTAGVTCLVRSRVWLVDSGPQPEAGNGYELD